MSTGDRYPFDIMKTFADQLWSYLAPAVTLHDIAGSVRRYTEDSKRPKDATCGDIELVLDADRQEVLRLLMAKPDKFKMVTGGERLVKCELHHPARGKPVIIPVQLNFATTLTSLWGDISNYGWKFLLATGDAEWNQMIVLERKHGGLKPPHIHKADKPNAPTSGFLHVEGEAQHTPTEQEVFKLLGLPFVPPHRRNAVTARELRAQLALQGTL